MHILFVAPYPFEQAPSQRFLFEQYLGLLEANGHTYELASFYDKHAWRILHQEGHVFQKAISLLGAFTKRMFLLFQLPRFDYVFIHREAGHAGPPIWEWMAVKIFRKKIIYDFDDAIWLPNFSEGNRRFQRLKWYSKVWSIMKWSYKISAGNPYLAERAGKFNNRVTVNPTTIDTENLHNRLQDHRAEPLAIGWTGSHTTLKYLNPLVPLLQRLVQEIPFKTVIIANEPPPFSLQGLEFVPWKKETEAEDLLRFHIGIMPLKDDEWSRGKCGFKALQYMAMGIPALVSPVGVNTEIVDHGHNGFVCKTDADWEKYLKKLLTDKALRAAMGQKARLKIDHHYSVKANADNFMSLFS